MKKKIFLHLTFYSIFWIWNIAFLGIAYFWILPSLGYSLIEDTFSGLIPSQFLITFFGIIAIPTISTIFGGWRFRKQPLELIRLFYGVEAPLFLLCLLRLFVLRELTPASSLILATILISIIAFALELFYGYAHKNWFRAWLQLFAHIFIFLTGLYLGILLLFYALPFPIIFLREFFSFDWIQTIIYQINNHPLGIFSIFLYLFIFIIAGTLFVFMPSAMATLYFHSGQKILRMFAFQYGKKRTFQGILGLMTAWMILLISFNQQPQVVTFQMLDLPVRDEGDRQELLANSDLIKNGLVNAYLSSYRYLGMAAESNQIRIMYKNTFGLPEPINQTLQNCFNNLISPFLYQGDDQDKEKAANLYREFFDTPIQKGEEKAILKAIKSTANLDKLKAGLLNIGKQKVWLKNQEVTVTENGDWANIELYEVYENQTFEPQEILYYFTLPKSAVITGIWLGDTNNRASRFPFQVSPRGAAQKVDNSQVINSALIEKVGPRQYRLRLFPIPPKLTTTQPKNNPQQPTQMHLWLTYQTMVENYTFALPQLTEKHNIFWNRKTKRIYNGKSVRSDGETWLPPSLTAVNDITPQPHQVNFPNGYQISAEPLETTETFLPESKRFAIVIDTSYSMKAKTWQLQRNIDWLVKNGFGDLSFANSDADIYLTNARFPPQRFDDISQFDAKKVPYFRRLSYPEMLKQFLQLRGGTRYSGVILVTDESGYKLSDGSQEMPKISIPVWMLHLGGMPPAYDDATLKFIEQTGGGVATKFSEIFPEITAKSKLGKSVISVADGYAWFMERKFLEAKKDDGFAPLAAQQLVLTCREVGCNVSTVAIANTYNIVTPFSSMIVLVNDEQREAFQRGDVGGDGFLREVEDSKEVLTEPNNLWDNVGLPKPGMFLGVGAMGFLLIYFVRE